jgi:hypothetical protein
VAWSRRSFLWFAAALPAAASVSSCRHRNPEEELVDFLGLTAEERGWVSHLSAGDQRYLLKALSAGTAANDRRARDLLFRLIQPRDRLFAYVGYPDVNARRSVCDGLLRE